MRRVSLPRNLYHRPWASGPPDAANCRRRGSPVALLVVGLAALLGSCGGDTVADPIDEPDEPDNPVVANLKPHASMAISTDKGYAPLRVFFGGGGGDPDGVIVKIEWDFEGDGIFDQGLAVHSADTSMSADYTYTQAGTYAATVRVTDDDGATATASTPLTVEMPVFPGFDGLSLRTGGYWEYSWIGTDATNLNSGSRKSGTVRITLGAVVHLLSGLSIFSTTVTQTGDAFPVTLPLVRYGYVGVKDGVLYKAKKRDGEQYWDVWLVFDPQEGAVGAGMMDYFNSNTEESLTAGTISNSYWTKDGVTVAEFQDKPFCEVIGGVVVCGDEAWHYSVEEYYVPGIGFAGFYRSGTYSWSSPFPGGSTSSTVLLALTASDM